MKENGQKFGIVIVAHGGLAQEYLATLQHVIGQQERIEAVSIVDGQDKVAMRQEISELVERLDEGSGVVIVTDMYGGTPSNLAMPKTLNENRQVLYGVNMPALIKLARMRDAPLERAIDEAVQAGHRYLNFCKKQG